MFSNLISSINFRIDKFQIIINGKKQEAFFFRPSETNKLMSVITFLHGHINKPESFDPVIGFSSYWLPYVMQGWSIFLPLMPGSCGSEGEDDFAGPETISCLSASIHNILLHIPNINRSKVIIHGFSKGAMSAALLLEQPSSPFKAAILQSGIYDFRHHYETAKDETVRSRIEKITQNDEEAFRIRSAITAVSSITCPLLILHGNNDQVVDVGESLQFSEQLNIFHKIHQTIIYEQGDHRLTGAQKQVSDAIEAFLHKHVL